MTIDNLIDGTEIDMRLRESSNIDNSITNSTRSELIVDLPTEILNQLSCIQIEDERSPRQSVIIM